VASGFGSESACDGHRACFDDEKERSFFSLRKQLTRKSRLTSCGVPDCRDDKFLVPSSWMPPQSLHAGRRKLRTGWRRHTRYEIRLHVMGDGLCRPAASSVALAKYSRQSCRGSCRGPRTRTASPINGTSNRWSRRHEIAASPSCPHSGKRVKVSLPDDLFKFCSRKIRWRLSRIVLRRAN